MSSRGPYRRHAPEFKIQLCQDIRSGAIGRLDAAKKYTLSTNLIQLWLAQYDRGELSAEEAEASVITEYDAKIAALERKVGQLTMELNLVKKNSTPSPRGLQRELLNRHRPEACSIRRGCQVIDLPAQHVLLPVDGSGRRSGRHPARRVDWLHPGRGARLRLPSRDTRIAPPRLRGQSQAGRLRDEGTRPGHQASQAIRSNDRQQARLADLPQPLLQRHPDAAEHGLGRRLHLHPHRFRVLLPGGDSGRLQPQGGGLAFSAGAFVADTFLAAAFIARTFTALAGNVSDGSFCGETSATISGADAMLRETCWYLP